MTQENRRQDVFIGRLLRNYRGGVMPILQVDKLSFKERKGFNSDLIPILDVNYTKRFFRTYLVKNPLYDVYHDTLNGWKLRALNKLL